MQNQLDKYLKTGYFNQGIEIHPFKHSSKLGNRGIITIINNKIKFKLLYDKNNSLIKKIKLEQIRKK